ncbi:HIT domain-containing protein [Paraglaciecola sp. MB-3u-78]|jgi:diadenosine tetraphosphate (Ap4A) HIT family hydrolase|uniref:HIT domain-containing protein n=1 Tax=Paraglaciecola sp. MB-3u-78 TaxID=2058332 RepID=UPI000C324B00|nr:HIT family protein [Paraglaciecola sp. MB-3u-78]PKG99201.1 HIT family protein [Paraglaciecola sp. MB-3u-78]
MTNFVLHPQLEQDSELVTELVLCSVRLINDANYPWLILVPRVANISDVIDLSDAQQQRLWQESARVSRALKYLFTPDKLNIAALGNMVPQLHLHHIVRYQNDVSWPKPIWGQVASKAYSEVQLTKQVNLIQTEIEARRDK